MCSEQKLQIRTPHRPVAGTAGETDRVREGSRAAVPVDAAAGRQQEGVGRGSEGLCTLERGPWARRET